MCLCLSHLEPFFWDHFGVRAVARPIVLTDHVTGLAGRLTLH